MNVKRERENEHEEMQYLITSKMLRTPLALIFGLLVLITLQRTVHSRVCYLGIHRMGKVSIKVGHRMTPHQ